MTDGKIDASPEAVAAMVRKLQNLVIRRRDGTGRPSPRIVSDAAALLSQVATDLAERDRQLVEARRYVLKHAPGCALALGHGCRKSDDRACCEARALLSGETK